MARDDEKMSSPSSLMSRSTVRIARVRFASADVDVISGVAVLVVAGIAGCLAVTHITEKSFWLDEAFSAVLVQQDWARLSQIFLAEQANMSGYHVLLRLWVAGFGSSEAALRALSAIFSVLSIPAIYGLGKQTIGRQGAIAAAILLSINAFNLQYAQEARGYSLALLMATLCSYFFIRGIQRSSFRNWGLYVVTGVCGLYAHIFVAFPIGAHYIWLVRSRERWQERGRNAAVSLGVIAVLAAPLLLMMSRQGHLEWLAPPTLRVVLDALQAITGGGGRVLMAGYLVLCSYAVAASTVRDRQSWALEFLWIWLALPFVITIPYSLFVKPIFVARYLIVCVPPLVLLAAAGITALTNRYAQAIVLLVIAALAVRGMAWYFEAPKEDWRTATEYVLTHAQARDGIVWDPPYGRLPSEYYVERWAAERRAPTPTFPSEPWGTIDPITPEFSMTTEASLQRVAVTGSRVWVISRGVPARPLRLDGFSKIIDIQQMAGITVRLHARGEARP
jgi:hypothetical protein